MGLQTGKLVIFIGLAIVVAGIVIYLFPGLVKWFGHLPGDIKIVKEHYSFYFPVTTMLLLSLLFTLILNIIRRL